MHSAVIIDAVRTPAGKNGGKLKDWHPASLGAHVLQALAARNPIDVEMIDDVIFGCVMQVGPQTLNVARNAVLTAGWPESVPATTFPPRPSTASAEVPSRPSTSPRRA